MGSRPWDREKRGRSEVEKGEEKSFGFEPCDLFRPEYARRIHVVCTTLSIAIARTTDNTLLHGANTLLVTGHTF